MAGAAPILRQLASEIRKRADGLREQAEEYRRWAAGKSGLASALDDIALKIADGEIAPGLLTSALDVARPPDPIFEYPRESDAEKAARLRKTFGLPETQP